METHAAPAATARGTSLRAEVVRTATAMIGVPYRFGGATPRGFDCSGLVVYSYARAGLAGLPHSVVALEHRARPIPLDRLQPGDLLFFDLEGRKAAHVAIYLGGGAFVHAPSAGKRVERVALDHVYWGTRVRHAGRLAPIAAN
jgi:murein DD-endopeptidase